MSFQNHGFWLVKGAGCADGTDVTYDNSSRIEPKRAHQWFVDTPEAELFPNKKQAVGVPTNNLFSGLSNSALSPFSTASNFQSFSNHFTERLFDSESARTPHYIDQNAHSDGLSKMDMGPKIDVSSFGLSMPHHLLQDEGPVLGFGGVRKVKVSQVKDCNNILPLSMDCSFSRLDNNLSPLVNPYNGADESMVSIDLAYNKSADDHVATGIPCGRENIFIATGPTHDKVNECSLSTSQPYEKIANDQPESGPCVNSEGTMISFNSYHNDGIDQRGEIVLVPEFMNQQVAGEMIKKCLNDKEDKEVSKPSRGTMVSSTARNVSKQKEDMKMCRKSPVNSFPSNVRSLLSTGLLDDVPVKYVAWSREKELKAIIKGSGYLCGCEVCNFSKVVNAYEFERHANCKTKHPNNHIYFENGKTIYGIVQELRSTPQDLLFDAVQTITGSPLNQRSFQLWKESYLLATRELQRIYGKDDEARSD